MVCNDIKCKALEPTSATDEVIINALYNGTAYEERPTGELADEVWKLYEKHHSHLATHVIKFGDELKELLGKYQNGGADMRKEAENENSN